VFFRLSKSVLAVALAFSIGLHWGFLQSAAWVGMVISYSRSASLGEAIEKTFDGKHPCPLCKAVAEGKKSEQKQESSPAAGKLDFFFSRTMFVFSAPKYFWEVDPLDARATPPDNCPPTPPPEALHG
jgi:hypothetical protein